MMTNTCYQRLQVCLTWKTFITKLDVWLSWQPSAHCVGWTIQYDTLFLCLWISCKQLNLHMHGLILFHFSAANLWLWSLNTKETLWHLPCSQRHCFSDTSQQCYNLCKCRFWFQNHRKTKTDAVMFDTLHWLPSGTGKVEGFLLCCYLTCTVSCFVIICIISRHHIWCTQVIMSVCNPWCRNKIRCALCSVSSSVVDLRTGLLDFFIWEVVTLVISAVHGRDWLPRSTGRVQLKKIVIRLEQSEMC